jgi:uncharacterized protein
MKNIVFYPLALTAAMFLTHAANAASFDCEAKTLAPDERAICANRDLNDLDVRMVTEFKWLSGMYAMGVRGELQDQQTAG